jgi:hypothetical protein
MSSRTVAASTSAQRCSSVRSESSTISFEKLVRRQANKIAEDKFFGVKPHEIAQLKCLAARCVDEIPVPIVDNDDVAVQVEP